MISATTWKIESWRVELAPAITVVYKCARDAPAIGEGFVLAGGIMHPPTQMR
jgi:hypothetical protein